MGQAQRFDLTPTSGGYTPLRVDAIRQRVEGLLIGSDLRYYPVVESTNGIARDLLADDWQNGTAILTDFQEVGRGRQGRSWVAPPGSSLLMSVVVMMPEGALVGDSVMLGALAVADSVTEVTGLSLELKWPNDVLAGSRKVCGILAESSYQGSQTCVILGMGINVNFDPQDHPAIPETATTLQKELGRPVSREALAVALFNRLDLWYRCLTQDAEAVYSAWASRLQTLGAPLLVVDGSGTWEGIATGVRRDGGLLVRDNNGVTRSVYAADVSIRRPGGFTVL